MNQPPSPPPQAKAKSTWELRALGLSLGIVAVVGGLSRLVLGLLAPLVAVVGLDGVAGFLVHVVPVVLAFIATLVLSGLAAQTESRGAGFGAWLGFGLVLLLIRGLDAL